MRPEISPRRKVVPILAAEHIRAALAAAQIPSKSSRRIAGAAARGINEAAQSILTARESPGIGDLRATRAALQAIETGCAAVVSATVSQLAIYPLKDSTPAGFAKLIEESWDPLIVALRDTTRGSDREMAGAARLAEVLMAVDELRFCAHAAGEQFDAGIRREKSSRATSTARSPSRSVGFEMIKAYQVLTEQPVRLSRRSPDSSSGGQPSGPLIRFLGHLFSCLRRRVAEIPQYAGHKSDKAWAPDEETLALWIRQFGKEPPL